jgi:hypothetical protein
MTAANFRAFVFGAVAVAAAALSASCNLEPSAADKPTYEADVRPIFMSRCIRCHGSPPLADPTSMLAIAPIPTLRFDVYGDTNCGTDGGTSPGCVHGAAYEAKLGRFSMYLVMYAGIALQMPPPPAPQLTSYQIDTIVNWEKEAADGGTPLEK